MHLLGALVHGGLETWLMEMVRKIDRRKVAIDVCVTMQKKGAYEEEFQRLGCRIHRCPLRKNLSAFAKNLRQILRQGEYDILESHHYLATGYFLRVASKIPHLKLVAHMHPTADMSAGRMVFPRSLYRRLMKHEINRYAEAILGASVATLDAFWGPNWRDDPRLHYLPNGIDLSLFEEKIDRSKVRTELNLPKNSRIILTVASYAPHKNQIIIPEIATKICQELPDVYFVLNGVGPLRNKVENKVKRMGIEERFRFIGGLPSLIPLWKASDVFLFPSLLEGFGIVVIEAAAAGLPVVAHRIPGVIEAASACHDVTLLSTSSSNNQWCEAIEKALKRGRLTGEEYQRFKKDFKFTSQKSLEELLKVYSQVSGVSF